MPARIPAPRTCLRCGNQYTVLASSVQYAGHRTVGKCPECRQVFSPRRSYEPKIPRVRIPDLSAGLCWDTPDDATWYGEDRDPEASLGRAIRICQQCPVREICGQYAIDAGERWGVWGGLTPEDRKRRRRRVIA